MGNIVILTFIEASNIAEAAGQIGGSRREGGTEEEYK
jgi:hypothetical protein